MSPLSRKGLSISQGATAMAASIPTLLHGQGSALGNQSKRAQSDPLSKTQTPARKAS